MNRNRYIIIALTIVLGAGSLSGCQRKTNKLLGDWAIANTVNSTPIGFQLMKQGMAASINQPQVMYDHWEVHKKQLILSGKRFEEDGINDFSDTIKIVHSTENSLTLIEDSLRIKYRKLE